MTKAYNEYSGPNYFRQLDPNTVKFLDEELINKAFEIADEHGECFITQYYTQQFWKMQEDLIKNIIIYKGKIYSFKTIGFGDYAAYNDHKLSPLDTEFYKIELKSMLDRLV